MSHEEAGPYKFAVHHSEEEGKKLRKRIWLIFWVLLAVTIVEVSLGLVWKNFSETPQDIWWAIKTVFLLLTVGKAYYIVMDYMHLGHERKAFKYTVLAPYIVFVAYLTFICLNEALHSYEMDRWLWFMR